MHSGETSDSILICFCLSLIRWLFNAHLSDYYGELLQNIAKILNMDLDQTTIIIILIFLLTQFSKLAFTSK